MSFINKLNNNLPGYLIHIPERLKGNMLKPKPLSVVKAAVIPIMRLITTGGEWVNTSDYLYYKTSPEGMFLYSLVHSGTDTKVFSEYYDVGYDPINRFFYGIGPFAPTNWATDDIGSITSAFPSDNNMKDQHWYDVFGTSKFSFNNPCYVPDESGCSITGEPVLSTNLNTYTIAAAGNNIDEQGFYYSINGKAFNFTTNDVVIRTFVRSDKSVNVTIQGSGGAEYSASIDLIYTDPTINSVNITSAYNNINITMNITNPQYGWQSTLINNDTPEVREVTGYQYGLTERFTNMNNGDWVYRITGDKEFVSEIFTLNYDPPIPPVQLIKPTGGKFFNARDYKYFETTPSGRFLYGLIIKGETERHLDGNFNDVEYDTIEKSWYDIGIFFPTKWNEDDGQPLYDVWPTTANLPIQFWYNANDSLQFHLDDPYFETTDSIITDLPILTQEDETYTIQVVGNDNLETKGWYYSINNNAFNFTTDTIQTRSFTTNQTVTVTVQGTGGYEFTSSIDLVIPSGYKYLGFYDTAGSTHGWLNEIDLTLTDGSIIDQYNQIPINKITLVAPLRPDLTAGAGDNKTGIFDGQISNTSWDSVIFKDLESGILLYMQSDTNRDIQSGVYYTRTNNYDYQIDAGKMYGTNTDPTTFVNAQDVSNWNHICDLTKKYDPVGYPYYSYATVIAKGTSNTTIDLNDFQCSIWTNNGRVLEYPPTAAKINIEGYESVTRSTESGLLIDGSDDGYTWTNTSINTYNTLLTFSIDEILEVDGITLKGAVVPDDLIIMIHNWHDNPTKEEIENENHNVKYIYSDTTMFDNETGHFTYTRIVQAPAGPVVEPVERLIANGGSYNGLYDYLYIETNDGRYLYNLVETGTENKISDSNTHDVEYDPSDNRFYDIGPNVPHKWGIDHTGTNLTAFKEHPTAANMQLIIGILQVAAYGFNSTIRIMLLLSLNPLLNPSRE